MAKESLVMKALKEDYVSMGLDIENTCKKTEMLLKIYRKVSWSTQESFDDLNEITYANCMSKSEFVCYLLNFAPDKELDAFESRAVTGSAMNIQISVYKNKAVRTNTDLIKGTP